MSRPKKSDLLDPVQLAEKNKLEREICSCSHARIVHGAGFHVVTDQAIESFATGHGQCYVTGCRCPKFQWHHEIDLTTGRVIS